MRIVVVSGHYMPEVGFQEVHLAKAYVRMGHEVHVLSSTAIAPSGKKVLKKTYKAGNEFDEKNQIHLHRFEPVWEFKSKVVAKNLRKTIREINPDNIIIVALAKFFALPLLETSFSSKYKITVLFGDASEYISTRNISDKIKAVFHNSFFYLQKGYIYSKCVRNADRMVMNIPEAETVIKKYLPSRLKEIFLKKRIHLNLGYDPTEFYYEAEKRIQIREQLKIGQEETVVITCTRVNPEKRIESILEIIDQRHKEGSNVHYILIGLMDDEYEQVIRNYISKLTRPNHYHLFPFLKHNEIRGYYSAADIGLWIKAAISIQEAMGTGLFVILENKDSVNHLIKNNNGSLYENGKLPEALSYIIRYFETLGTEKKEQERIVRLSTNENFLSYDVIAQAIISSNQI
jgi:glycosyltransferase involved in cell wall biosynthesis